MLSVACQLPPSVKLWNVVSFRSSRFSDQNFAFSSVPLTTLLFSSSTKLRGVMKPKPVALFVPAFVLRTSMLLV